MPPSKPSNAGKKLACFALVYLVWGSTYLGMKIATGKIPPFFIGGSRFLAAGACLLLILTALGKFQPRWLTNPAYWRGSVLVGMLMMLGANGLLCASLGRPGLPSGLAALIVASTPIWMLLLDRWQTGSGKFTPQIVAGLTIGLVGVGVLMSGKIFTSGESAPIDVTGCLMVLVSCILWSAGSIVGRKVQQPPHPLAASSMQMISGGVMMLALSACIEQWRPIADVPWDDRAWIAWAYLAIFGSMISFSAFVWLMHNVSAASVSTYAYVNPLIAMLLGWIFLGEQLGFRTGVAAVLVLSGVVLIQLSRRKTSRARRATTLVADSIPAPAGESLLQK
ncbi:MAG: EamA family transporter [Planctomycetes bacterium]|nr:EamA family transporter [Planctomycetota bacterium]